MRALALIAIFAACHADVAGEAVDGEQIFAKTCATCHGPNGKPSDLMTQRLGVRDLTSAAFRARVTVPLVMNQVRSGSKNKLMPSFEGALSDAQIQAVAEWVAAPSFVEAKPAAKAPPGSAAGDR